MKEFSINYKIWIETSDNRGVLGDGKWKLLKSISETGSLKKAMEKHGLAYRKTWDNLNKIEEILGFNVIVRTRGGKEGGNTCLTPQGQAIVDAFDKFHKKYDIVFKQALKEIQNDIEQIV